MYKLIAVDMDGTLLNDDHVVPANNIEYLKIALSLGVNVSLCSGRPYTSLQIFEEELGLVHKGTYGICYNGSIIYNTSTKDFLLDLRIKNSLYKEIVAELEKFAGDILIYADDYCITKGKSGNVKAYEEATRTVVNESSNIFEINEDVSKVLLLNENHEYLMDVQKKMLPFLNKRCDCFFSQDDLLECTANGATKGNAITFLAKHLGIDIKDVIAIGDNSNDVSMIKAAGLGIAVRSGIEEAKNCADYITESTNNDGVIEEIVKKFILK